MKKFCVYAFAIISALSFVASGCDPIESDDPANKDTRTALERYWADDYTGVYGFQAGTLNVGGAQVTRMFLGGKPLYATGMNCFNLFTQSFGANGYTANDMEKTVAVLQREQVSVVRFSCSPFYAEQFGYYFDNKQQFLSNLDSLATWCDRAHIALIPSIFWNTSSVPTYYGEAADAWGDTGSKTYAHMLSYTEDIVNTLKDHKSLAMWEFGNEFSLQADIEMAGYAAISAAAVETAYKGFAEKILSLDPHQRIVSSGNSIMRNSQYHQYTEKSWTVDSWDQYKQITGILTPEPMKGMSEHIYEEARQFSDKGTVDRSEQISYAKQVAAALGKAYYVGEFTGPKTASGDSLMIHRHFMAYYAQRVQLSLMWNYAFRGDVEYSFKADTPYGNMAFRMMREYNEKFKTISE